MTLKLSVGMESEDNLDELIIYKNGRVLYDYRGWLAPTSLNISLNEQDTLLIVYNKYDYYYNDSEYAIISNVTMIIEPEKKN